MTSANDQIVVIFTDGKISHQIKLDVFSSDAIAQGLGFYNDFVIHTNKERSVIINYTDTESTDLKAVTFDDFEILHALTSSYSISYAAQSASSPEQL